MPGSQRAFCSGVPASEISSPAISERVPSEPAAIQARLSSSVTTHIASLPRPRPPYSGAMQTPKVPSSAISVDDLVGDQHVVQVPLVGLGRDALVGEAAELLAHHRQVGVDQRLVDAIAIADRGDQRLPVRGGVAFGDEPGDRFVALQCRRGLP
jgi:hypothetical protein